MESRLMSNNLIGFGAFGQGDVADPRAGSSVSITSIPRSIMLMTGGATTAAVPGGYQQPQLAPTTPGGGYVPPEEYAPTTPGGGYVPPEEYAPEQGVGPDGGPLIQEKLITNGLPGEVPPESLFFEDNGEDNGGFIEQPSPNGDGMDTKTMIGLGLLAAAVLAGGYWFFIAKKPKGEQA
jgi:hypothetical protein